ncbi:MAG: uroporphyrinogen decarboxylase family protein [Rectinemataceae bacterium]
MSDITELIGEYLSLLDSDENRRRLSLWDTGDCGIRGETQWHGVPNYTTVGGRPMPVTAECLEKMWENVLGMDIRRFYTDPDYFLEYFLRYKIFKFKAFPDDTPLTPDIPVCFGVTHEAGILGQRVLFLPGQEPQFAKEPIIDENSVLPKRIDFSKNEYLAMVLPYYERVKVLAGSELRVIFPVWYRGPQGVALYIRGFENFSIDTYMDEAFTHRVLRYVTDAAMQFALWRAEYTKEPIARCDLFNDDIPLMSPDSYEKFFLPYEQEISDFHGGVWYWHSCGDITKHVPALKRLKGVVLLDFGVTMEKKADGLKGLGEKTAPAGPRAIEFRVMAKSHIQEASDAEQKDYVRGILAACRERGIDRYVIRSSGMSILLGGEPDIRKLARWVELVREVQAEEAGA